MTTRNKTMNKNSFIKVKYDIRGLNTGQKTSLNRQYSLINFYFTYKIKYVGYWMTKFSIKYKLPIHIKIFNIMFRLFSINLSNE